MPLFVLTLIKIAATCRNAIKAWLFRGGWKVLLIALGMALTAIAVRSCTTQGAEIKASQVALKAATSEIALTNKATGATARAETHNIVAKAAIASEEQQGLAQTETALAANPDWALQPIPTDVLASLQ